MARIRTIKPEFPQSESMGRVSREARLCFIMLWTISDDYGRLRGNSRMLASLLYPYDEDAGKKIEGWLSELVNEGCISRYSVGGDSYMQVINWDIHQKVDKPSKSKIPLPREDSRECREESCEDQGPRTKDQGRDQGPLSPVGEQSPEGGDASVLKIAPAPIQKMVEAWNACGLPEVKAITDTRRRDLGNRWRDTFKSMDAWREYCERITRMPFLMGSGSTGWRANIDFALKPGSIAKINEGHYQITPADTGNNLESAWEKLEREHANRNQA